MYGRRVENKENKVADDIDYYTANKDINDDLGNFILPKGLTPENRSKVPELRFAALIAQTGINFTQGRCLEIFQNSRPRSCGSPRSFHLLIYLYQNL